MNRTKIRDLALVALAGGLLSFEVTSLRGAAPLAMRSLVEQGVVGDVQRVSTDAAVAAAWVVTRVSRATTQVAVATVKRAARLIGTVTPARDARGAHVRVVTVSTSTCRQLHAQRVSLRRLESLRRTRLDAGTLRELRREIDAARRGTTS
jgi:hypothetical protein